jgi:anti-sigma factor RsiW
VSCQPERVTGYVDDALPAGERAEMEAHLEGCTACREQADAERDLRQRLRGLSAVDLPMDLALGVRRALRPPPRRWPRVVLPLAAGAAFLLLWLRASPPFVAWELLRDHRHCFGKATLAAKVWGNDPARVAAWFANEGRDVPVVPEGAAGLTLVGGRDCQVLDRKVVHLYYADDEDNLSLYVVPGQVRMGPRHDAEMEDHRVRLIRVGGRIIGLVSSNEEAVAAMERALTTTVAGRPGPSAVDPPPRALLAWTFHRGAVAQLGARVNGIHEVTGSIPVSSTNSSNKLEERPIR